jgi:two-component system, sensor histidine kinase YesM
LNLIIYSLAFISFLFILILSFLSTKIFSHRVESVISAIKKIRKGDLSVRISVDDRPEMQDEIGEISSNINIMCTQLSEYIKNEYVSGLRQKDAQLRKKEAQLYALQSQVNPHFLYNSLEIIRMKALKTGDSDLGRMIYLLSDMYRSIIKDELIVSLENELNYSKKMLEFYNIRYENRLELIYSFEKEILGFAVIKHLIQPIIENVLVHGINYDIAVNIIEIKGFMSNGDIVITVTDNGPGIESTTLAQIQKGLEDQVEYRKDSIGIANVNSRIKLTYGDQYGITIESLIGHGTVVTLKFSTKSKKELLDIVQGTAG